MTKCDRPVALPSAGALTDAPFPARVRRPIGCSAMSDLVTLQEIEDAARRLAGVAVRTPLVPFAGSPPGTPSLRLKPESLQPVGSFKLRGAYAAVSALSDSERKNGV